MVDMASFQISPPFQRHLWTQAGGEALRQGANRSSAVSSAGRVEGRPCLARPPPANAAVSTGHFQQIRLPFPATISGS